MLFLGEYILSIKTRKTKFYKLPDGRVTQFEGSFNHNDSLLGILIFLPLDGKNWRFEKLEKITKKSKSFKQFQTYQSMIYLADQNYVIKGQKSKTYQ